MSEITFGKRARDGKQKGMIDIHTQFDGLRTLFSLMVYIAIFSISIGCLLTDNLVDSTL